MTFPQKNIELPYDLTFLLGHYPKELEAVTGTGICSSIFIAALFTISTKNLTIKEKTKPPKQKSINI